MNTGDVILPAAPIVGYCERCGLSITRDEPYTWYLDTYEPVCQRCRPIRMVRPSAEATHAASKA
jgi:hypothetical protein